MLDGGSIYIDGNCNLLLNNVNLISNLGYNGGSIYIKNNFDKIEIYNSSFSYNNALNFGGSIYLGDFNKNIHIINTFFYSNKARISGGGIYISIYSYHISIKSNIFNLCEALYGNGGSIAISSTVINDIRSITSDSNFFFNDVIILNSKAKLNGGGIFISNSILDTSFKQCIALIEMKIINSISLNGGAIFINDKSSNIHIETSFINNNNAKINGGGIYIDSHTEDLNITNTLISGNYAIKSGGGIYLNENNKNIILGGIF